MSAIREFTCSICDQTFEVEDGWTDEDAAREMDANFPATVNQDPPASACDECYARLRRWLARGHSPEGDA